MSRMSEIDMEREEMEEGRLLSADFGLSAPPAPAEVAPAPPRTVETVTLEIRTLQRQAQQIMLGYAVEIGRRLEEVKAILPHGQWGDYLKNEVDYSQSTANNFMRIYREYGAAQQSLFGGEAKSQAFANLTYTKALRLLAIPDEEEREQFMAEHDVGSMSNRELDKALKEGRTVLLEGQLGTLKDPDHGIYPMVTSSSTLAAYGAIGAGLPPYEIQEIITVCKAYSSAVGAGAFVSEIFGEEANELRTRGGDGGEFGATTGRPRRMGWFDCVASRYGCRLQGTTDVAFTVLDVLGYLEEIPVCVGYEIDGQVTTDFPVTAKLEKAKPVLEKLPGWNCDIRGIRKYEELPENCRRYVEFIEERIGYPITMVSNGPGREDIIYRESPLKK